MSAEDLEAYEAEIELELYQEYKAVVPTFRYVVETERRFYLANDVDKRVVQDGPSPYIQLRLSDAWVWDMYRRNRFIATVDIVTFRDVNIEELPQDELSVPDDQPR